MRTVHLVDDDESFRASVRRLLSVCGYEVKDYSSAEHLIEHLPSDPGLGCIVLDIRMPGMDGLALQDKLNEAGSELPIVFLSGYADVPTTVRAVKAGAEDVLTKPVDTESLLQAIERALSRLQARKARHELLGPLQALVSQLTPRERQVFEHVVRGKMNKHIARELGVTERTIKAHRRSLMERMQVQTLAELVSVAQRLDLVRQ